MTGNKLKEFKSEEIPKWLNEEFFLSFLKKNNEEDLKIKIVSVKPAVAAGENFVAGLYRVKILVTKNKIDTEQGFIIKFMTNAFDGIEDFGIFAKETKMYLDFLPKFEQQYKAIGEMIEFAPKCYATISKPLDILVFEDMNMRNYIVQNRTIGLDMKHSKLFLTKLAQMHAASAAYHEIHGSFGDTFQTMFRKDLRKANQEYTESLFPFFMEMIRENEVLKHLAEQMDTWLPRYYDEIMTATTPSSDPDDFNVLCHGDPWTNNILFSYDANHKPNDAIIIDHQANFWGSPACDLLYFIVSSTQHNIKEFEFDNLISFYHSELVNSLIKLKYTRKIPSLRNLHVDILKRGFFGAYCATIITAIASMKPRDDASIRNFMDKSSEFDELRRSLYRSSHYIRGAEIWYTFLERRGMLDFYFVK